MSFHIQASVLPPLLVVEGLHVRMWLGYIQVYSRNFISCLLIFSPDWKPHPRRLGSVLFRPLTGLLIIRGKKSEISRDLKRQIRGENGRFRGIFAGIFGPNFRWKANKKAKKKDSWQKYWKDVKFRARKKHKSSSNTVLKATVLVSSDKKNIIKLYRNAWPVNLLFQLQFRAKSRNAINFFPLIALLCCFAVYKARLF